MITTYRNWQSDRDGVFPTLIQADDPALLAFSIAQKRDRFELVPFSDRIQLILKEDAKLFRMSSKMELIENGVFGQEEFEKLFFHGESLVEIFDKELTPWKNCSGGSFSYDEYFFSFFIREDKIFVSVCLLEDLPNEDLVH